MAALPLRSSASRYAGRGMQVTCPSCGGRKLKGRRDDPRAEVVDVRCQECGHTWTHDPWACPRCRGRLHAERRPLLEKARGTQQSIIGYRTIRVCPSCDPPDDRSAGWMSAT